MALFHVCTHVCSGAWACMMGLSVYTDHSPPRIDTGVSPWAWSSQVDWTGQLGSSWDLPVLGCDEHVPTSHFIECTLVVI